MTTPTDPRLDAEFVQRRAAVAKILRERYGKDITLAEHGYAAQRVLDALDAMQPDEPPHTIETCRDAVEDWDAAKALERVAVLGLEVEIGRTQRNAVLALCDLAEEPPHLPVPDEVAYIVKRLRAIYAEPARGGNIPADPPLFVVGESGPEHTAPAGADVTGDDGG